ncbi:ParB/RepB/Spo0J family partition protein [Streptomyces albireticuli]|uniref:Chromosome partitioning protein ParB n=1 Tax=Streptomyces albireticuli TaxID=1940 RepID=A0A2A2D6H6_9ACTN|nr:ParB/RepB/Spo0J family partition protein [Streptomyces albireticuli]MCD9146057.1 ParB/RepB/Spo0J family partition protein [Streptomyces albireticuli]MCD9165762.1 ParB/RepB/Spo0J family partition protein [Streptomyces albireticuli]MCD9195980.1 ParB/RepB/Spo0J family partition protein [Streptomyces albireticuli]PAU46922.1 chromosome partitioning protein ParB [Streptomyces albireticuli]
MSKADQMGESSAFSRAGTARSARGRAISSALEGSGPNQLALHLLGHNPDNPREQLGDVTDLANSLRDHGQKQPLGIMTRDAYLEANPGRDGELEPRAMYVVIDGNRRLAAAREAGLSSLKVMVDDSLGGDHNAILESALVANIHREAFEPLDEAKALQQLLEVHQTQDRLAKRLHRSQGWVSQRLALLKLTPELQRRLEAGEEPVDLLRAVGRKAPESQEAVLQALKEQKAQEQAEKAARKAARQAEAHRPPVQATAPGSDEAPGGLHYDVMKTTDSPVAGRTQNQRTAPAPDSPGPDGPTGGLHYDVMKTSADPAPAARSVSPGPAHSENVPTSVGVGEMPWHSPAAVLRILREHMQAADFEQLVKEGIELL